MGWWSSRGKEVDALGRCRLKAGAILSGDGNMELTSNVGNYKVNSG
jgi:hypothetical protein